MNNAVVRGLAGLRRAVAGPDYPRVRAPGRPAGKLARFGPPLAVLALLGLLLITYQYLWSVRGINLMAWALAALTVAPAALMLDRPLLAWRLCIVGGVVGTGWATAGEALPWNPVQVFVTLAVLVVVALRADRVVVFWVGLITVFVAFYFVPDPASFYGLMLLVAALLAIGSSFRRVRQVEGELAEQAGVTEREQARRGLLEERARIARELHDV
ncbi:MAG TPA: hypothetical protein VFO68_09165, partial [Actinophytocola sp.]|nr:hypothetical protein [Actinophytocola sp.]